MSFRDNTGHLWELTLDLVACRRVRDLVGVNLLSMHTAAIFSALADPIRLVEILFAVVKPQADMIHITEEDFLRRMAVDTEPVVEAFVGRISGFFLQLGRKSQATQLETSMSRSKILAAKTTPEELTRITEQTFDWMESQIRKSSSGDAVTNSPELSESIPTSPA
jgi:hypothetical protein